MKKYILIGVIIIAVIAAVVIVVRFNANRNTQDRPDTVKNYTQHSRDEGEKRDAIKPVPVLVIKTESDTIYAALEDNSSAKAFAEKLSGGEISVDLHDYGGFEKVGALPWALPENNEKITTEPGDVILHNGNQITIYYGENTWNLTRLAKINGKSKDDLLRILGKGDVTVTLSAEWSE